MGNQLNREGRSQDYLKEYLAKFDSDEVEVLRKIFKALAARSPGNTIDKETFLQYFPLPGLWGERLFQRFDFKGTGSVDYEEFLIGIAICCRGTKTDRIHVLFQVFDLNCDGYIQKSELVAMLSNLPNLSNYVNVSQNDSKRYEGSFQDANAVEYRESGEAQKLYNSPQCTSLHLKKEASLTNTDTQCTKSNAAITPGASPPNAELANNVVIPEYSKGEEKSALTPALSLKNSAVDMPTCNSPPFPLPSVFDSDSGSDSSDSSDSSFSPLRSKILSEFGRTQMWQAEVKKNPSTVAQSLITKEEEEKSTKKVDMDVDELVDKIIEECEFFEQGQLSFAEFKAWLECHDRIMAMFTECLHEELWGFRSNALYRTNIRKQVRWQPERGRGSGHVGGGTVGTISPAQAISNAPARDSTLTGFRNHTPITNVEIRPDQFYKIRRLFVRSTGEVYNRSIVGALEKEDSDVLATVGLGTRQTKSDNHSKNVVESKIPVEGSSANEKQVNGISISDDQLTPYLSEQLVSEEIVTFLAASNTNLDTSVWQSQSNTNKLGKSDASRDLYFCPSCKTLFLICARCFRRYPTLKLVDGRIVIECALCLEGSAHEFTSCWHCNWEFNRCTELLSRSEPMQDGLLYKRGKHLHQWKSRYYVLIDNMLYYYKKKDDVKPKGFMFLEGCYVDPMDKSEQFGGKVGFSICHRGECFSKRVMFANSIKERDYWMDALRVAMKQQSLDQLYQVCEQIGQGKFSIVYRGIHRATSAECALKVIDKGKLSGHERELLRSEMAILHLLQHPNVIYLREMLDTKDTLYISMELVKGGELFDLLNQKKRLAELHVHQIISQLITTVSYLHKCGIIHRDIKPENILLSDKSPECYIKLTDFGLSTLCGPNEMLFQPCGTLAFVSPEVLLLGGYNHKVDVWSIGVVMYLLLRGKLPFSIGGRNSPSSFSAKQYQTKFDGPIWKSVSSSAKDLIVKLLQWDPRNRISIFEAAQHIWIKNPTAVISEASPEGHADEDNVDNSDVDANAPLIGLNDISVSHFSMKAPLTRPPTAPSKTVIPSGMEK